MNKKLLFSSDSSEWETPQDLFDKLNEIFHFDLDVCATAENKKCVSYYSKEDDALIQCWGGACYMNPPYGRKVGEWIKKAYEESQVNVNSVIVCLVPARTDTKWWQEWAMKGEVFFLRGRLKFSGSKNAAPFPSAIVVFRLDIREQLEIEGIRCV